MEHYGKFSTSDSSGGFEGRARDALPFSVPFLYFHKFFQTFFPNNRLASASKKSWIRQWIEMNVALVKV